MDIQLNFFATTGKQVYFSGLLNKNIDLYGTQLYKFLYTPG